MGPKESQVHTMSEMWTQQVKEVFNHAQRKCPGQRWQEVGGIRESVESVRWQGSGLAQMASHNARAHCGWLGTELYLGHVLILYTQLFGLSSPLAF